MQYIGSAIIPDWRYDTPDRGVKTSFFATTVTSQGATAADDIVEVRWFKTAALEAGNIVDTHQPLFALLANFLAAKDILKKEAQNAATIHAESAS
jgi:hypothetical protein